MTLNFKPHLDSLIHGCYGRFLGILWAHSMPSCDVNTAMPLAEASWRRDNRRYGVYLVKNDETCLSYCPVKIVMIQKCYNHSNKIYM